MENSIRNRYEALKMQEVNRKSQFDRIIDFIETETSWLNSTASTKYHLCSDGGDAR